MVQEYGRYFGMPTCCLRGGCLTGPNHAGVELHGFLSYLVKCNLEGREYRVFGYKGKQVRDNIHSRDVARFIHEFIRAAARAGRSTTSAGARRTPAASSRRSRWPRSSPAGRQVYTYVEENRIGDHICYYSDLRKMRQHYPAWDVSREPRTTLRRDRRGLAPARDRRVRILITGACGFVGSTLARTWIESAAGHELIGVDSFARPGSEVNRLALRELGVEVRPRRPAPGRATSRACRTSTRSMDAAANPSVLAGVDGRTSSRQLVEHNLLGTVNLLEDCRRRRAAFVLLSTSRVYSIPPLASLPTRVAERGLRAGDGPAAAPLPRGSSPEGIDGVVLDRAARLAVRLDQGGERAARPRVRGRLRLPGLDRPLRGARGGRAVRPARPGHLRVLGEQLAAPPAARATSASTAAGTRCATASIPPTSSP